MQVLAERDTRLWHILLSPRNTSARTAEPPIQATGTLIPSRKKTGYVTQKVNLFKNRPCPTHFFQSLFLFLFGWISNSLVSPQNLSSEHADLSCHFVLEPINSKANLGSTFSERYWFTYILHADKTPVLHISTASFVWLFNCWSNWRGASWWAFVGLGPQAFTNIKIHVHYFKLMQLHWFPSA